MSSLNRGEFWRNRITGMVYRIKAINDQMVVLESADGLNQVLSTRGNLDLFYINVSNTEDGGFNLKEENPLQAEGNSLNKSGLKIEKRHS